MAYSMFERPKLHNTKSMKFYPEDNDRYNIAFRHKNLPPNFDMTVENYGSKNKYNKGDQKSLSIKPKVSSEKKCQIYVHSFGRVYRNDTENFKKPEEGDFVPKSKGKKRSSKVSGKHISVIDKLEESYWATWKPEKTELPYLRHKPVSASVDKTIKVIKGVSQKNRIKIHPEPEDCFSKLEYQTESRNDSRKSQEIQTDLPLILPKTEEVETCVEKHKEVVETSNVTEEKTEECDSKFLKHTDSLILNARKQNEEKEHFEQPKCIRLYKKPAKMTSRNYVRGGSYPLKSCLKQESSFAKGNIRLGRPGSPLIVSSTYSSRYSKVYRK